MSPFFVTILSPPFVRADVEDLVMRNAVHGKSQFYALQSSTSLMAQGKLRMRVDILSEDEARRIRPEEISSTDPLQYELRMVLWSTKDIRMPEEKDRDKDVDQTMTITTNFTGERGEDILKDTDTAWYSAGGAADWNWRMVWPLKLPCQVPRIKLTVWDDRVIGDKEAIGECMYSLQPMIDQALRDKKPIVHRTQQWIPFTHPNYPGQSMGEVLIELWLLTKMESEKAPVGEAQEEPNKDPFLTPPKRNPPPWAVGSRALAWLEGRKLLIIIAACIGLALIIAVIGAYFGTR